MPVSTRGSKNKNNNSNNQATAVAATPVSRRNPRSRPPGLPLSPGITPAPLFAAASTGAVVEATDSGSVSTEASSASRPGLPVYLLKQLALDIETTFALGIGEFKKDEGTKDWQVR